MTPLPTAAWPLDARYASGRSCPLRYQDEAGRVWRYAGGLGAQSPTYQEEAGDDAMNKPLTIVKNCPECGRPLVERTNRVNGSTFLGCSRYPECTHTEPIPESVRLRLAGNRDMFDDLEEADL